MEDAEKELKRRRERGRTAQAAFRKRQAKVAHDTQHENEQLKEALDAIISKARPHDRGDLVSVIKQAAKVSGINADHLEMAPVSRGEVDTLIEADKGSPMLDYGNYNGARHLMSKTDGPSKQQLAVVRQDKLFEKPRFQATQCMMWLNPMRYMRIDQPPEDIVPYLGAGADTVAGRLFWAVLEHAKSECHHVHRPTSHKADHTMGLGLMSQPFLNAMIEARLEYRQLGYISAELAGAAELGDGFMMMRKLVEDHLVQEKYTVVWLTPLAVEARVRSLLGSSGFALLEEATKCPDGYALHLSLVTAVERLVERFICFGDGPRWSTQVVDETFTRWLSDAS